MSSGWTEPTSSVIDSPSSVIVWRSSVWLEIVISERAGADLRAGETVTLSSWITPVSPIRHGGPRLVLEVLVAAAGDAAPIAAIAASCARLGPPPTPARAEP